LLKTCRIQLQINCPGCNSFHNVSSLTDFEHCQNCGKGINAGKLFQGPIFGAADTTKYLSVFLSGNVQQMGGGGANQPGSYRITVSSLPVYCEECETLVPGQDITEAVESKKPYSCRKCNHVMPVKEADSLIKSFHPQAIAAVNDASGFDLNEKQGDDKSILLVFKCMTCGAGLEIDKKTDRSTNCSYCGNANYIPDTIWYKLHPGDEAQPIFMMIDITEDDINAALDYFTSMPVARAYEKHFVNFIYELFAEFRIEESVKIWLKVFLNYKQKETASYLLDAEKIKRQYYQQLQQGFEKRDPEFRKFIAGDIHTLPVELQNVLASDADGAVRLALTGNRGLDKEVIKKLKKDSSKEVSDAAGKLKTGLFGKLFG
jgi:DNA-directed RNA polymerase subunit RPC12/RpoP